MRAINDESILKRAQFFCDQNGTTWDRLTDYNRRRYLARAREQLLDEETGRLVSQGLFRDPQTGGVAAFSLVEAASNKFPIMIEPQPTALAAD